ncbi:Uma2 family endonuclease [Streptomyces sp. NPDC003393]
MSGIEPEGFEALLDALVAVDEAVAPTGFKAEIVRGSIVLSPWSKGYCTRIMRIVSEQLTPHLPEGHVIDRTPNLFVFPGDESAYGPDVWAAHERVLESDSYHLDGEALSFVAELTSTATRKDDLIGKVEVYGRAGVPVYLVLDMQKQEATAYGAPSAAGYEFRISKPFGEKLPIPEPFDCTLDTSGFRPPEDQA